MQKSGVLPTIVAILFVTLYSNLSSICLTETGRLIYKIKNSNRKTDYLSLITLLIKDSVFAFSSKVCVLFNHFLYIILCIITLYKIFFEYVFSKTDLLKKNNDLNLEKTNEKNFLFKLGNEIFNRDELIVLFLLFIIFGVIFLLNMVNFIKRSFQFFITIISFIIVVILFVNLSMQDKRYSFFNIPTLFGKDYTYV